MRCCGVWGNDVAHIRYSANVVTKIKDLKQPLIFTGFQDVNLTEEEPEVSQVERKAKVIGPCWVGQARNAGEPQEKGSLGGMGFRTILSLPAQTDEPLSLPLTDKSGLELGGEGGASDPRAFRRQEAWVPALTGSVIRGGSFSPSPGLT